MIIRHTALIRYHIRNAHRTQAYIGRPHRGDWEYVMWQTR